MPHRPKLIHYIFIFIPLLACLRVSVAQTQQVTAADTLIGMPASGTFEGSDVDSVQANNGNLHIELPLFTVPGRGLSVKVLYVFDSKLFYENTISQSGGGSSGSIVPCPGYNGLTGPSDCAAHYPGWRIAAPLSNATSALNQSFPFGTVHCQAGEDQYFTYTYYEPNGTSHATEKIIWTKTCITNPNLTGNLAYMTDGSGIAYYNQNKTVSSPWAIYTKDGTRFFTQSVSGGIQYVLEDANGNQITRFVNTSTGAIDSTVVDTLGRRVAVALTYNSSTGKYELPYYDSNGNQQKIVVTLSPVNIQTNLCGFGGWSTCSEYSSGSTPWQMPTEIDLPNGMKYTIGSYNAYGMPSSLVLPTGGTISYTYGTAGTGCADAGTGTTFDTDGGGPRVTSRTVTSGTQTSTWNYTYICGSTNGNASVVRSTVVTDPLGNDTVHQFLYFQDTTYHTSRVYFEAETDEYSGSYSSGTLLKQVQTTYQTKSQGPHLPLTSTTTWPQQGNLQSHTETDWDSIANTVTGPNTIFSYLSWRNAVDSREYAFGIGAYGAEARRTHFNYAHLSGNTNYNVNYLNLNIADLPTEKQVYDGNSNLFADSKDSYDGTAVTTTSGVPNHDYTIGAYRGNLTQSSVWLSPSTWINTNNTFNDLGHMLSTTDPLSHTTNFTYADSWSGATCGVGTNTQGYLTQTQAPDTVNQQGNTVHHRSQTSYYACTGFNQSSRDENDILANRAGTTLTYDLMHRPLNVTRTDGGQTNYSYNDTPNSVSITTNVLADTSNDQLTTVSLHDGLGRVKQTQLTSDPEGTVYTDTTYDLLGRKSTVSNPYRSGSEPTAGTTTYQYDPLDRVVKEIPPDGSSSGSNNVQTSFGAQTGTGLLPGLATTVTDQAGKKRMSVTDALGRLIDVWEPDSTGSLVNETAYAYDPLNNLLSVTQKGNAGSTLWRTRSFVYDSLSHLTSASNPESGQIQWTYDNDSNVLTKKDARGITITYNYDQLHRVATVGTTPAKQYSNSDHQVDYFFDQTSYNGLTIHEGVNHRTGMSDATGQSAWTFDSEGRTLTEQRTVNIPGVVNGVTRALNYTYNLDGSLASLTYPSGHVVNYTYSTSGKTAGRTLSAIDPNGGTPINYLSWDCPKTGVYCYSPHGAEQRLIRGATSTFAGVISNNAYNNRLQPSQFIAANGSTNVLSLNFNFNLGGNDNGTLARIVNNVSSGLSKTFTYDPMNRIMSAANDSTSNDQSNWGNIYAVDVWGDMYQKNPCDGTTCPTKLYSDSFLATVNNNKNQFDGYSYDSNGNMLNDQLGHSYSYDAENRPYSGGGANYYYDGEGERVAKSNGTLYLFGTNSAPVVETDLSGNLIAEYIFANGGRIATRKSSGSVYYYFADQVGSAQVVTDASGTIQQQIEYHPYGEQRLITSNVTNNYRFTGKEHDTETDNDYFGARYYRSSFGRFLTPDWAATPEPVPYAVMGNPQTLNLYSYVENNPITGTDPDGHFALVDDAAVATAAVVTFGVLVTYYVITQPQTQHALSDASKSAIGALSGLVHPDNSKASPPPTPTPAASSVKTQTPPSTETTNVSKQNPGTPSNAGTVNTSNITSKTGTIYVVPGSATKSGKPYVGRHNKPDPAKTRKSNDGRDRTKAKVVDTYPANNTQAGRVAEQNEIDKRGGVDKLDNQRNEIAK